MTTAQVVETSVTNKSFWGLLSPDHTRQTTDTPLFKPFTILQSTIHICNQYAHLADRSQHGKNILPELNCREIGENLGCLETSDLETSDPRSPLGPRFLDTRKFDYFSYMSWWAIKNVWFVFHMYWELIELRSWKFFFVFSSSFCCDFFDFRLFPSFQTIKFSSIRVDNPVVLVVNKKKLGASKVAPSVLAVTAMSE